MNNLDKIVIYKIKDIYNNYKNGPNKYHNWISPFRTNNSFLSITDGVRFNSILLDFKFYEYGCDDTTYHPRDKFIKIYKVKDVDQFMDDIVNKKKTTQLKYLGYLIFPRISNEYVFISEDFGKNPKGIWYKVKHRLNIKYINKVFRRE